MDGYIKFHRKILENPIVCKDSDYFAIWSYLLLNATHKEYQTMFKGEKVNLLPGQLITGRKSISGKFNINESKVQRVLKKLEIEQQIEQQTSNENRLITIVQWHEYQCSEQPIEQPVNNERTTSEQRVNTNKKVKNDKNDKKEIYSEISDLYNSICISFPKLTKLSDARKKAIKARLNIYTLDDFKNLFELSENSNFLKGKNERNWSATFDWLIKDSNMVKVLDGNYNDSKSTPTQKLNPKIHNFQERNYTKSDYESMEQKLLRR